MHLGVPLVVYKRGLSGSYRVRTTSLVAQTHHVPHESQRQVLHVIQRPYRAMDISSITVVSNIRIEIIMNVAVLNELLQLS